MVEVTMLGSGGIFAGLQKGKDDNGSSKIL
jgi:hypothetical protein